MSNRSGLDRIQSADAAGQAGLVDELVRSDPVLGGDDHINYSMGLLSHFLEIRDTPIVRPTN